MTAQTVGMIIRAQIAVRMPPAISQPLADLYQGGDLFSNYSQTDYLFIKIPKRFPISLKK
jgi:hypothetical protein